MLYLIILIVLYVKPWGYSVYMVKAQWNTIILDGTIPQGEIERMIDNSYMLVVSKMTKKDQQSILLHN